MTQYTFSAEQREMSSVATVTMNDVDGAIMCITVEKKRYLLPCECLPLFSERIWWPIFCMQEYGYRNILS